MNFKEPSLLEYISSIQKEIQKEEENVLPKKVEILRKYEQLKKSHTTLNKRYEDLRKKYKALNNKSFREVNHHIDRALELEKENKRLRKDKELYFDAKNRLVKENDNLLKKLAKDKKEENKDELRFTNHDGSARDRARLLVQLKEAVKHVTLEAFRAGLNWDNKTQTLVKRV